MSADYILFIIIAVLVVNYGWEQVLDYLNLKHQKDHPPEELSDICDTDTYQKTLAYHRSKTKFGFISSSLGFVVMIILLLTGSFGLLDQWLRQYFQSEIWLALSFFGTLFLATDLMSIPLQWYNTFVLEERFGFNKTTPQIFWTDKLQGYVLASLLGAPLIWLLLYLIIELGPGFWFYFLVAIAAFSFNP